MSYTFSAKSTLGLLSLALVMATVRLVIGPTAADRIIALDLLAVVIVGYIASICVIHEQPIYLDVATALAVIAFIGTVAYSRYLMQCEAEPGRKRGGARE